MENQTFDPAVGKGFDTVPKEEAESFVRIEFHVESASQNTTTMHWAECGIQTKITGLKEDLKNLLPIPVEKQIWTLRSRILDDNQALKDYGITGNESFGSSARAIQIYIKRGQ